MLDPIRALRLTNTGPFVISAQALAKDGLPCFPDVFLAAGESRVIELPENLHEYYVRGPVKRPSRFLLVEGGFWQNGFVGPTKH